MAIEDAPFDKKGALVATKHIFLLIICAPVPSLTPAHTLLDLPARQIGIHQHITRMDKRRTGSVDHNQPPGTLVHLNLQRLQTRGIEKLSKLVAGENAKDAIVCEVARQHLMNGTLIPSRLFSIDRQRRA